MVMTISLALIVAICYEREPNINLDTCTHRFCEACVSDLISNVRDRKHDFPLEENILSSVSHQFLQLRKR